MPATRQALAAGNPCRIDILIDSRDGGRLWGQLGRSY